MKKFLIGLLLFIWQLPQNLVAIIMWPFLAYKKVREKRNYATAYEASGMNGGISLGSFIYLSMFAALNENTVNHEFGHVKQSHILGPLYLLVIGIPSILWAISRMIFPSLKNKYGYYDFYTEKWADKLGGVVR